MAVPAALTEDRFLDGKLVISQPRSGYRAATDPVLLAASVDARAGQTVLELGCGVGVASLCLARRVPGLEQSAVELQPDYAALARHNAALNALPLDVHCGDVADLPRTLRDLAFDHVMANPPYYLAGGGTSARDAGRETALREVLPLAEWIAVGLRRLRPGGWLTVIQDAARLPDLLAAIGAAGGDTRILPVASRAGQPARRVLLRTRKGQRGPFRLGAPLVMHLGAMHDGDRESYSAAARAILRDGAALHF